MNLRSTGAPKRAAFGIADAVDECEPQGRTRGRAPGRTSAQQDHRCSGSHRDSGKARLLTDYPPHAPSVHESATMHNLFRRSYP